MILVSNATSNRGCSILILLLAGVYAITVPVMVVAVEPLSCPGVLDRIPPSPQADIEISSPELYLSADFFKQREDGISVLRGGAEVVTTEQKLRAEEVTYDNQEKATFFGDVQYWYKDLFFYGNRGSANFSTDEADLEQANYIMRNRAAHGKASYLHTFFGRISILDNATYSTCTMDKPFWYMSAKTLELKHEKNQGDARHAILWIKNIPVFYSPWLRFPIERKRKSGFLPPNYANTSTNGFELQLPYYWNIAPNMDATLTPVIFSGNNPMAKGEFRYLFSQARGNLNFEYLYADRELDERSRNILQFRHEQYLLDRSTRFYVDFNRASDKLYFRDFGNRLSSSSQHFLDRIVETGYAHVLNSGARWDASVRIHDYQSVSINHLTAASRPYNSLPRMRFAFQSAAGNRRINYALDSELSWFERSGSGRLEDNPTGNRIDLYPWLSYPLREEWGFLTPKVGLHYTQYYLENNRQGNQPSRLLPMLSMDSGLYFERNTRLFGHNYLQTLDPRVFYLYVPKVDHSDIPIFDTSNYTVNYNTLFYENRFSGKDRIGDANQVSVSVSSEFIRRNSGNPVASIRLGQSYYFRRPTIGLRDTLPQDSYSSPLIANLGYRIQRNWRATANIQWHPDEKKERRYEFRTRYQSRSKSGLRNIMNFSYRYNEYINDRQQLDLSASLPLQSDFRFVGRWVQSLTRNRLSDGFGGLEYRNCCVVARALFRRFVTDDERDSDYQQGFFFQISFVGLTSLDFGSTFDFLHQQIAGYDATH